jgi:hypothetical protein
MRKIEERKTTTEEKKIKNYNSTLSNHLLFLKEISKNDTTAL